MMLESCAGFDFLHSGWNKAVFCFCVEHGVDNR